MNYRWATDADLPQLADWNYQLIRDEGHANPMTRPEFEARLRDWLAGAYQAVIFDQQEKPVAYALYRTEAAGIYLRQFFVAREQRRQGLGREALRLLLDEIWPPGVRVTLEVLVGNQRGYQFWRSLGFQDYAITLEMTRKQG